MAGVGNTLAAWRLADRKTVHESDAKMILAHAGIAVPVRDPAKGRCVVKLASDRFPHKSDHGLVKLNVPVADVAEIARDMRAADLEGEILVEEMIADGVAEWIVGCRHDATFGPIVVLGAGGVFVELFDERKIRLAPVDRETARRAILSQKAAKLLTGVRGRQAGDVDALVSLVVGLSQLFFDNADAIEEIEINPVIVRPQGRGAVAADALMTLRRQA